MPQIKKATAPPPPKNSGRVGASKGFKSQQKKDPAARKRPIEALIYGEELLNPDIKRAKEIVVCFYPFTKNNYRISTDGKFIIERIDTDENFLQSEDENLEGVFAGIKWNLFYFPQPINDFTAPENVGEFKNISYEIKLGCHCFTDFISVKNIEDKVVTLIREEYLKAKQEKLDKIKEQELKYEEDLKKLEEEEEKEDEQEREQILSGEESDGTNDSTG